jgi:outer membrane protein OmpA-like peptidoglycan-associated protein
MNLDPFAKQQPGMPGSKSKTDEIFVKTKGGGLGRKPAPAEAPEPMDMAPETAAEPEKETKKAKLSDPKWDADKVGFNEEAPISVALDLPPDLAHKTKVSFELFAKTPKGPERVSQAEGVAESGRAKAKIPVYIPNYQDEDGNRMEKAEYYFNAKHSEAEPLDGSKSPKLVDEKADRVIESHIVEGANFAFDSSFLHPDQAGKLKNMCASIGEWRKKDPDGKLVSYGHADLVGDETYNKGLSERRARSVHGLLIKDPQMWEDLHKEEKWNLSPVQALLKYAGEDPGAVDGQDGPKTQAAVKSFQGKNGLTQSGTADADTRKALYKKFMADANALDLKAKDFDAIDGKPHAGCSEFNPLEKTQGKSETNRRVTVLFLKSNKNFPINFPCKQGSIAPCQAQVKKKPGERRCATYGCFFYDDLVKEEKKAEPPKPAGKLKLLNVKEGEDVKQYVNMKADKAKPELGNERLIEAEVEGGADGAKVFWKVTAAKENGKRNDPKPGPKPDAKGKLVELKDGVAEIETEIKGGKASFVLACGFTGGDKFTVEAATEKGKPTGTVNVVNWRKLYFQLTHHKDITPPSMATAKKQLLDVFIEWEEDPAAKHALMPKGNVIVGNHNAAEFHALLASPHAGQCGHIILCDKQYDGLKGGSNVVSSKSADFTKDDDFIQMSDPAAHIIVPSPPVQKGAKAFLSGSWENKSTGKKGTLTDDASKATDDIGLAKWNNDHFWEVILPKHAGPTATKPVTVSLDVTAASGPWGGDGGTAPHNLIVIDPSDTIHTQCCLHELGHIMNMVPYKGYYKMPPGFTLGDPPAATSYESTGDHTHSYDGKRGGSGSHCSFEIDKAKSTLAKYVDGKCIMFHQLNSNCKLVYCPECAPLVKAQALEKFHELKG